MMKKMACQIAGETRLLMAVRERTESTTNFTSVSYPEGRCSAVPCPPSGEARVEEQFMSAAAAWPNARIRAEPPE